jgi:nitrogen regulatory protein P-II 2
MSQTPYPQRERLSLAQVSTSGWWDEPGTVFLRRYSMGGTNCRISSVSPRGDRMPRPACGGWPGVKLIQAVIDPGRLAAVQEALSAVEVFRLTVNDVTGLQRPVEEPGLRFESRPRVRLDIAVNENFVRPTVEAVFSAARADAEGDAVADDVRILVLPLKDVIRIRTGERGPDAV